MNYLITAIFSVLACAALIIWPEEVLAFSNAVFETFFNSYVTNFFVKATFLVNCL